MSSSSISIGNSNLTCAPCLSKTCREPVWKEDLFYTGHSQVPLENSDGMGTCCCEKTPEPPACKNCSSCPHSKGLSLDVRHLFQTESIKDHICKYKEKVKGKTGICSIV